MITIYSTDSEGRLFTDPKQRFYLDSKLLQEKAYYIRRRYLLDQIAECLGYSSFRMKQTLEDDDEISPEELGDPHILMMLWNLFVKTPNAIET